MIDYRELCAELVNQAPNARRMDGIESWEALLARARAALAQPTSPTDGEVRELVDKLGSMAADAESADFVDDVATLDHAIRLLSERHPTPVPVSERPWKREGWCNEQGKCWLQGKVEGDWRLINPLNSGVPNLKYCFTFSLPAHALPLPAEDTPS